MTKHSQHKFVIPWDAQQGFNIREDRGAKCDVCKIPYYKHQSLNRRGEDLPKKEAK